MSNASAVKTVLFLALFLFTAVYVVYWIVRVWRSRHLGDAAPTGPPGRPTLLQLAIGFVTNFFDTLGIGSFAPTTSVYKLWKIVPDERIPGTLNVGHALAAITQAFIFIAIVEVDMTTLVSMIGAAIAGAWLGAGIVASWPRRKVQIGMGVALLVAATLFFMTNLRLMPEGGNTLGLEGPRFVLGVGGNFMLGAFMTLGIGLYGPCMILISLLGMNPLTAFPIMMGSCAFLMPVASIRFIQKESYRLRPALGLALGGIPAVLIAAFIVKSLPLTAVRWLVVVVVTYTALAMLRSAMTESVAVARTEPATPPAVS